MHEVVCRVVNNSTSYRPRSGVRAYEAVYGEAAVRRVQRKTIRQLLSFRSCLIRRSATRDGPLEVGPGQHNAHLQWL